MAYPPPPQANVSPEWEQFLATDMNRDGKVSAPELQSMLAATGLVFSLQTIMQLINLHSPFSKDGTLSFEEFKGVQAFLRNIQASFQYFDTSRNGAMLKADPGVGKLSKSEVLRALHHAGFGHVDEGAVKSSCQAFDPDRSNNLSLDQYIAMTLFLIGAKKAFEAFDTNRSGRITLDFNQFVYAASKTR